MNYFLKEIQINKIFHLKDFRIPVDNEEKKHLIITGKNGSGKTVLLNALVEFFQILADDKNLSFLSYEKALDLHKKLLETYNNKVDEANILKTKNDIHFIEVQIGKTYGKIFMQFSDIYKISELIQKGQFIIAFYEANRKTEVIIPKNPEKPDLNPTNDLKKNKRKEFLKFIVDLKIQEALARNENQVEEANKIKSWFDDFTKMLATIFEEEDLKLDFNYKDYSFKIIQGEKKFGFNELSDGYSAIIDIIVDLILKMQDGSSLSRVYNKQGIVLIDEIETHLHLELQKAIMPMLTKIFPNIQFIVTTHSPFILSSLHDAVAFDLEKRERIEDLTQYSYEALAEGYFDVSLESSFLKSKLNRYKKLLNVTNPDTAEEKELIQLEEQFDSLNEATAPANILGEYLQLKLTKKRVV
jgi:predicted ATP-binding protein involved in virulence